MWRKLSTTTFSDGVSVTKYFLERSGGGIKKYVRFPKGSKMHNLGIGSTSLYTYKGEPMTLDIFTAEAAKGCAAGSQFSIGNTYRNAIEFLRSYIQKGENNASSFLG